MNAEETNRARAACLDRMPGIEEIAKRLSRINRFAGEGKVPYSVAAHCLTVGGLLAEAGQDDEAVLLGYLHDGAEPMMGDPRYPWKNAELAVLEMDVVLPAALNALGVGRIIPSGGSSRWKEVHEMDVLACDAERFMLKVEPIPDEVDKLATSYTGAWICLGSEQVRRLFLLVVAPLAERIRQS